MNRKAFFFYTANINPSDWQVIFLFFVNRADNFKIHFAEGDEDWLNKGISAFKQLSHVNIRPWSGMEDSIEISGDLSKEIKELFITHESPAFLGKHPDLWDFQFYLGEQILLYIGDFCDCIVYVSEDDLLCLKEAHIDLSQWDEWKY